MCVKMNLSIIRKNNVADPETRFLAKVILKPYGRATALPPAWELKNNLNCEMSKSSLMWVVIIRIITIYISYEAPEL